MFYWILMSLEYPCEVILVTFKLFGNRQGISNVNMESVAILYLWYVFVTHCHFQKRNGSHAQCVKQTLALGWGRLFGKEVCLNSVYIENIDVLLIWAAKMYPPPSGTWIWWSVGWLMMHCGWHLYNSEHMVVTPNNQYRQDFLLILILWSHDAWSD